MVAAGEWLELMQHEHLRLFIPGGGSSIKFVLGEPAVLDDVQARLKKLVKQRLLHFVTIDAAVTKIHMIQDIFFAIAREIDWDSLAQRWVEAVFKKYEYAWPRPGEAAPVQEIARVNGIAEHLLARTVLQWLTRHIMNDRGMAQDYRAAMTHLCMRRLQLTDVREVAPVLEWLRGDLRAVGAVHKVPIGSKINRHNGRAMLRSLCHWLHLSGGPGLAVVLDLRQLGRNVPAGDAGLRYTPAAVLDAFEVLRQLIDDGESFERFFVTVISDASFLDEDSKRSVNAYRALKERIWPDVHPMGHENPLAPLLTLGADPAPAAPSRVVAAQGDMPYSEERMAIEALRAGVPNRSAVRLLGATDRALCDRFVGRLAGLRSAADSAQAVPGEIVAGDFGAGKSHLLGVLAEQAMRENFIVSVIPVSKETPLFHTERMFAAAARNAVVPGHAGDVMTVVTEAISQLDPRSPAFVGLEAWANDPRSGLSPLFPALLYLIPKATTQPEERAMIARFLGGAKLGLAKVRGWLRAAGALKLFPMTAIKASDLVLQRIRFVARLFAAAGFGGWCVLIDELELIGRYSALQRGKSYAELCRWLGLDNDFECPWLVGMGAVTTDFADEMFVNRNDREKIPTLLEQKGLAAQARLAQVAMALIERRSPRLRAPDDSDLRNCFGRVHELYARSYGLAPPSSEAGGRAASTTMRHHIKSWITDWDIRRLYGMTAEIEARPLLSDYTENPDLEAVPQDETAGEDVR